MLIDTHCHIHDIEYGKDRNEVLENAKKSGVEQIICIGTDIEDSKSAVNFATSHEGVFASIGVHPNNYQDSFDELEELLRQNGSKIVAIGETGLDYHYGSEGRDAQIELLKKHLDLAIEYNLPVIFHVREAFDDFWQVFNEYIDSGKVIRGVMHSFSDSEANLKKAIEAGLLISVNGLSTFTKDQQLIDMFHKIPLERIIFETDAPYLTPKQFRGKINEPAYVGLVASYLASTRGIPFEDIAKTSSLNAKQLFNI